MAKKRKPQREEVAWIVTRLTSTLAKYIGRVYASTEAEAIQRAIAEFRVPPNNGRSLSRGASPDL